MCPANSTTACHTSHILSLRKKGNNLHSCDKRPWELLVVDDNRGDSELLCLALSEWKGGVRVHVVEDGNLALRYLRRECPYDEMRLPDLVLLDLHLPGKDGIEVLEVPENHAA